MLTFDDLYSWVRDLPIVDWHNHLDLDMIAANRPLGSLYEVWVKADPYKHRAMRICGESEELITGGCAANGRDARCPGEGDVNGQDARCPGEGGCGAGPTGVSPVGERERWSAWMRTLPKLVGNPLFAWAKMELECLGLDPVPYLQGNGENVSLAAWTPSRLLSAFNVEWMSPCVGAFQLGQRASRPLDMSAPGVSTLGQRASRPLCGAWTAAAVREFPCACADTAGHFSPTLAAGSAHRRNFPHIGQDSTLMCVTFRLADSLPESKLAELEEKKRDWLSRHPEPWDEATCGEWRKKVRERIDVWLDAGHGSCILADERCRRVVEEALEFFDANGRDARCIREGVVNGQDARCPREGAGQAGTTGVPPVGGVRAWPTGVPPVGEPRYRLHSYVVMPNHVHVLFELFSGGNLERIVQSWKSFTAKRLNEILGRSGKVWQGEYFDRLIRNSEHYGNVIRYIRKNGEAAKALARMNARWGASTGGTPVVPGRASSTGGTPVVPGRASSTGGTPVAPGEGASTGKTPVGGVRVVPSLRMNAGDRIPADALAQFEAEGCRVVDVSVDDGDSLESAFDSLAEVAGFAKDHGWTMLLHMGALRETSDRLRVAAGPAGGYAGMRAPVDPAKVAKFLGRLEAMSGRVNGRDARCLREGRVNGQDARCPREGRFNGQDARCPREGTCKTGATGVSPVGGCLPRMILLSLNPEAHAQLAVLAGSFNGEGMPGKVQLGPAWWWCDHEEGIRDVLEKNAAYGVLSTFVGMTTDSRSLLSFVRHDYFRRILCKWTEEKIAAGAFPDDAALIRPMLEGICHGNARRMVSEQSSKQNNQTT